MPHLHIEYSDNIQNLNVKPMLLKIHQALYTANYIQDPNDLKSRAISQCVLAVLRQHVPAQQGLTIQLCVEIIEMPKDCYSKAFI